MQLKGISNVHKRDDFQTDSCYGIEDEIKLCTEKNCKFQVGFGFVLANWRSFILK